MGHPSSTTSLTRGSGAGKTTLAKQLSADRAALHLTKDEWLWARAERDDLRCVAVTLPGDRRHRTRVVRRAPTSHTVSQTQPRPGDRPIMRDVPIAVTVSRGGGVGEPGVKAVGELGVVGEAAFEI